MIIMFLIKKMITIQIQQFSHTYKARIAIYITSSVLWKVTVLKEINLLISVIFNKLY